VTANYIIYDLKAIAEQVSKLLPDYTAKELMSWSIPDIICYMRESGYIVYGVN
jgi:hypothetical protein